MGLTNFPNGITSFGVPIVGAQGLITQGKSIFVLPGTGSDGNSGLSMDRPLKTLAKALTLATANQNDVVYMMAQSNTASATTDYQSSTLTWNKDLVHLIGIGAPVQVSQRSRIANLASSNLASVFTVSANGCIFANFQILNGDNNASALLACSVTGQRNYFQNIHFAGMAGGTTQSATSAADLKLTGHENVFKNCTIGVDTIARDSDPAGGLWLDGSATRNKFEDCLFIAYISNAGYPHVTLNDATAIDRWLWFKKCMFMTFAANKDTSQTEVFDLPASVTQGMIVLQDCATMTNGASAPVWTAGTEGVIYADMPTVATNAAGGLMTDL